MLLIQKTSFKVRKKFALCNKSNLRGDASLLRFWGVTARPPSPPLSSSTNECVLICLRYHIRELMVSVNNYLDDQYEHQCTIQLGFRSDFLALMAPWVFQLGCCVSKPFNIDMS